MQFVRGCVTAMLTMIVVGLSPARAVEAINVRTDAQAIDLTDAAERHRTETDRLLVSAAPGPDGIIRRMDVRAREGNTNWAVFALANSGDEQLERLIVVPHYRMVGSGVFWPDLGLSRVANITSTGERPDRQDSATADIFRITLDPGSVMTYVLELRTDKLNQLYLWQPEGHGRFSSHHAQAPHPHRFDPACALDPRQGRDRARRGGPCAPADRGGSGRTVDRQHLSTRAGGRRAGAHGDERTRRQDRADDSNSMKFLLFLLRSTARRRRRPAPCRRGRAAKST